MAPRLTDDNLRTLAASQMFLDIPEEEIPALLEWLDARTESYAKDELVFLIGDSVSRAAVVLEGSLAASFLDERYNNVGVTTFGEGETFGEALACLEDSYSIIEMRATTDCRIVLLDLGGALRRSDFDTPAKLTFNANLIRAFARRALTLNQKIRILSQRKLRDRVKVFLRTQKAEPDGSVRIPYGRSEWAEFLGANRSALSRELSAMQKEGIIELSGRLVRVLDRGFLSS